MNKQHLAERTLQLAQPEAATFGIVSILVVLQLIAAVISILKNYGYLDKEIQAKVSNPSWLMRLRLKRLARQHISDTKLADAVAVALPVAASELTPTAFAAVYSEV